MATDPRGLTLEIERVIRDERPAVYEAFTAPGVLARWWGPEGFSTPSVGFDPRAGHGYVIEMQPPEGAPFHLRGEFQEVDPPARLAYTFNWDPPDADDVETIVRLTFRDLGDTTAVSLTQRPFRTEARLELHRGGWTQSLDRLERLLSDAA